MTGSVLVVGGGIAGRAAARVLAQHGVGCTVLVVLSSSRVKAGGRPPYVARPRYTSAKWAAPRSVTSASSVGSKRSTAARTSSGGLSTIDPAKTPQELLDDLRNRYRMDEVAEILAPELSRLSQ